ncbi:MAG: MBL fold metallo-hydrolase [Clostridiaceae bacterium]|nr:MBL fold metallo-hydrolase [Clostridiaceae bacterium]
MNGTSYLRNPGVGAIVLNIENTRILVDAFNSLNEPEEIRDGDIILFTHDDADHFDPSRLPELSGKRVTVIGPPTIVKPILEADKAAVSQILPSYSQSNTEPWTVRLGDVCIKSFSTPHFLDWKSVHMLLCSKMQV